jgi:hypothetical protein
MPSYHHKPIKRFSLNGVIHDESAIGRLKAEYIRLVVTEMRISGYVPRFDIEPDFTVDYIEEKKYFKFDLSVHGVYTGKKQSEWIAGIDVNKPILIPKSRSKESSQAQV